MKPMERIVSITQQLMEDLVEQHKLDVAASVPKILVVEDDKLDAETLRFTLEATVRAMGFSSWKLEVASDAEKALELLNKSITRNGSDFMMVFLDLKLPGRDGIWFMERLREKTPNLPVVVVTGETNNAQIAEAAKRGYIGLIEKPLEREDIKEIFSKHRIIP